MQTNVSPRPEGLDKSNWMADITIPLKNPMGSVFLGAEGLIEAQLESWPLTVAMSACRFLRIF